MRSIYVIRDWRLRRKFKILKFLFFSFLFPFYSLLFLFSLPQTTSNSYQISTFYSVVVLESLIFYNFPLLFPLNLFFFLFSLSIRCHWLRIGLLNQFTISISKSSMETTRSNFLHSCLPHNFLHQLWAPLTILNLIFTLLGAIACGEISMRVIALVSH